MHGIHCLLNKSLDNVNNSPLQVDSVCYWNRTNHNLLLPRDSLDAHVVEYCPAVVYNDAVDMYYIFIPCHRHHHPFLANIEFLWLDTFDFSIPIWPSCNKFSIVFLITIGITIVCCFSSTPSTTDSSSTKVEYGLGHILCSLLIPCITFCSVSSYWVLFANSFYFSVVTIRFDITAHTWISTSSSVLVAEVGMCICYYEIFSWCVDHLQIIFLSTSLCNLGGASNK